MSITWQTGATHRLQTQKSGGSATMLLSESEEDHLIDQSLLEGDEEVSCSLLKNCDSFIIIHFNLYNLVNNFL